MSARAPVEWGAVLLPFAGQSEAPMLLGAGWFGLPYDAALVAKGLGWWPARFRTRAAARDAVVACHGPGTYFHGRLRVVRLTSTFRWCRP